MTNSNFLKKSNLEYLLTQEKWVTLVLKTGSRELVVPEELKKPALLVLDVGYETNPPVLDLEIDEKGFSCVLSFGGKPEKCYVPWESVVTFIFDKGLSKIGFFSEGVPAVIEDVKEEKKKPNGFLKLVD